MIYSAVGFRIRPAHCSARALKVVWGLNFNPKNCAQLPPEIADLPFTVGFWFLGGLVIALPAGIVATLILRSRKRLD